MLKRQQVLRLDNPSQIETVRQSMPIPVHKLSDQQRRDEDLGAVGHSVRGGVRTSLVRERAATPWLGGMLRA